MNFNIKEIFTAFMVLFAVIDIVGNIPIIIDLRKKVGHIQSEKASLIAGIIMIVFLFLGKSLLELIGIDVYSFAVAGSFILFFIALEMILGITLYKDDDDSESITATVFPLAFPLIAGPGSLTTLLSLRAEFFIENIIIDLRKKVGHIQSEKASLIAGFIMIVFLFLGQSLLSLINYQTYQNIKRNS